MRDRIIMIITVVIAVAAAAWAFRNSYWRHTPIEVLRIEAKRAVDGIEGFGEVSDVVLDSESQQAVDEILRTKIVTTFEPIDSDLHPTMDPEWVSFPINEFDVAEGLSRLNISVKTLARNKMLNPNDVYLAPAYREQLGQLVAHNHRLLWLDYNREVQFGLREYKHLLDQGKVHSAHVLDLVEALDWDDQVFWSTMQKRHESLGRAGYFYNATLFHDYPTYNDTIQIDGTVFWLYPHEMPVRMAIREARLPNILKTAQGVAAWFGHYAGLPEEAQLAFIERTNDQFHTNKTKRKKRRKR